MRCLIPRRSFRRTISRRNSDKGSTCRGLFRVDPARAEETVKAHYDRLTHPRLNKNSSLCLEPGIRLFVSLRRMFVSLRRTGLKELGVKQHRTPTLLDSVALQRDARGQLSKGLLTRVKNKNRLGRHAVRSARYFRDQAIGCRPSCPRVELRAGDGR
jgi:hypothetical protein